MITYRKIENQEKIVFLLDLGNFFVIIEMVFSKVEEVERDENDISAKQKKKIQGSWFQSQDEHKRRKKGIG